MATLVIGGAAYSPAVSLAESFSVWVKREWGDAWIRVPYLIPLNFEETVFPNIGQARLRWEYGAYVNRWYHSGGTLLPVNLENWMIKIQIHSVYGSYIGFIGVCIGEQMTEEGLDPVTGVPLGYQEIECADLSVLLKRRRVLGTFVGDGTNWVYLKRSRPFNRALSHYEGRVSNRSETYNADAGCYMFEHPGVDWSNGHIAQYLLGCFQPWYPLGNTAGGVVELAPLWYLSGQTDALLSIFGEYQFWGRDIHACLDQLIDRRRGFGAHIVTDGVGPIYLNVYSQSEYPISGLGGYVPANPRQGWVPTGGDHHIQASYQITEMRAVDEIVVESDEPIKVMATLGFDDGSLEKGWTDESQTAYEAATDDERVGDLYANVFSRFRVPTTFDMNAWIPAVDDLGNVYLDQAGNWWHHDMGLERYIPIEESGAEGDEPQYLEPFAVLAVAERTRDLCTMLGEAGAAPYDLAAAQAATNPAITETEFDAISTDDAYITLSDINAAYAAHPFTWFQVDKALDLGYPSCNMVPGDRGLTLYLRSEHQNIFGLNRFTGESARSPLFDYNSLLATVFFRTDEVLRVRLPVWTGAYTDNAGRTVVEANPQGRQILIVAPGEECWVVATNTVKAVNDGVLELWNDGDAEIIRNDIERLRWLALVAYVWYGTPRATARLSIQNHLRWFRPGDLIKATLSGFWWERVGTCVTAISHDCESRTQSVITGFGEMDPEAMAVPEGAKR